MSNSEDELPTPRIGAFSLALNAHDVYELTQKQGVAPDPAGRVIFRSAAGGPAGARARERRAAASIVAAEVEQEEQVDVYERGWWESASLAELREGWRRQQAEGKEERQAALRRRARQIRKPRAVKEEPVAEQDAVGMPRLFGAGGKPGRAARAASERGASRRRDAARRGAAQQGQLVDTGQRHLVAAGHVPAATTLRRLSRIQWTAAFKQQQFRPTCCAHGVVLPPIPAKDVPRPAFGAAAEADAAEAARSFAVSPPKQARERSWRPRGRRSREAGGAAVAPFVTGHRGRDFFVLAAPATVQEREALEKQVQGVRQGWLEEEGIEQPKPRLWMFRALARRRKKPPRPEFKNPSVAFVAACRDGNTAFVQTCLMAGLPHRMRDRDGVPMLNLACRAGHRQTAALLSSKKLGADTTTTHGREDCGVLGDTDTVAGRGYTALHEAAAHGQLPVCQMLVAAGADANAASSGKCRSTPLLLALRHNHIGGTRPPEHGLHLRRLFRLTHPHVSPSPSPISTPPPNIVAKFLIAAGAEVSAADARGRNALHYAAMYAPHDTVKLLLQIGMSTRHTDKSGVTAAAAAASAGRSTIAATIVKFAQFVAEDDMIDHMYAKLAIPCHEQVT